MEQALPGAQPWSSCNHFMFDFFEHTADLGIEVQGASLEALFEEAANALLGTILQHPEKVKPTITKSFEIHETNTELLLRDFLNQLLILFETQRLVFSAIKITLKENALLALAFGEEFEAQRHGRNHEVKAITYHGLSITATGNGFKARFIVDI